MTLEEYVINRIQSLEGKTTQLEQIIASKDMQLQRLKETLEVYIDDLKFMKGLFRIRKSSAGSDKIICIQDNLWEGDPGFDRLYDLCGFKEGYEDEAD